MSGSLSTVDEVGPVRRRLPQRVYWRRRIVVLAILGATTWVGFTALSGLFDDRGESLSLVDRDGSDAKGEGILSQMATGDAAPVAVGRDDAVAIQPYIAGGDGELDQIPEVTGEATGDATGEVTSEVTGEVTADRTIDGASAGESSIDEAPPSVDNPVSVHIVGDSDAGTFGPYLQKLLDSTQIVETSLDYKVSSGLARPDFFNWPDRLATTVPQIDPDIVVVTFGGNDSQGLSRPQNELSFVVGDPLDNEEEWSAEYERRVLEMINILSADGRQVIWVGSPNDNDPVVTAKLRIQDQAVRSAIEKRPDVIFIDTWNKFMGRNGNWAEYVVDPRDGIGKDVRADDGYHLNVTGAEILAIDIAVKIQDLLRERGATI